MKFASLAATALALALPSFALPAAESAQTLTLSYDNVYDNPSTPLSSLACSDGVNGLITKGYTDLGSLRNFPNVGGVYTVTGWNSPACGTCYQVTWNSNSIYVLAVDVGSDGFNVSEEAMNTLTGGLAAELGRVIVTSVQVDASNCKI